MRFHALRYNVADIFRNACPVEKEGFARYGCWACLSGFQVLTVYRAYGKSARDEYDIPKTSSTLACLRSTSYTLHSTPSPLFFPSLVRWLVSIASFPLSSAKAQRCSPVCRPHWPADRGSAQGLGLYRGSLGRLIDFVKELLRWRPHAAAMNLPKCCNVLVASYGRFVDFVIEHRMWMLHEDG